MLPLPTTATLLNWMVQSTFCLGVCWLFYQFALRKESCFHFNRWFLQVAPWLALGLPLLPLYALGLGGWLPSPTPDTVVATPVVVLSTTPMLPVVAPQALPVVSTPWSWLAALYAAGVLFWLGRLGWQLAALRKTLHRFPHEAEFAYTLVCTGGKLPISSFGHYIFWDDTAALTPAEAQQVLHHELAHVQQGHTREKLHLEVLRALLWFNPFVHLLPRALRLTHEYLADAAVLAAPTAVVHTTSYAALLARLTLKQLQPRFSLSHSFASSQTLTRIAMLHSRSVRSWKRWLVLPLSAVLFVTLAGAQDKEPVAPIVKAQTTADQVYTYQQVEQVPIYETGTHKLFEDIIHLSMHSPKYYSKASIAAHPHGRITIQFTVTESGNMQNVAINQSGSSLEESAAFKEIQAKTLASVQNLPGHWVPGRQAGKAVPVLVTLVCDVNPAYTDTYLTKYPDQYHLTTDWSFNGVDTRTVAGISIPIKESTKEEINKYAIRPDPSYYKTHKRQ